jgi:hypothetical protein
MYNSPWSNVKPDSKPQSQDTRKAPTRLRGKSLDLESVAAVAVLLINLKILKPVQTTDGLTHIIPL